jgi:hypothetical protein
VTKLEHAEVEIANGKAPDSLSRLTCSNLSICSSEIGNAVCL